MNDVMTPEFIDNPGIAGRASHYAAVTVDVAKVMKSWRQSLYAYEWVNADGTIKSLQELSATEQPKRQAVEDALGRRAVLQKPILGIGIMDNVEIGSGRATFLTLAAHHVKTLPVHVPVAHRDEFARYLA